MTIACIVVAFRPDNRRLAELCGSLMRAGTRVLVVDNTEPGAGRGAETDERWTVLPMGRNAGIAAAQNAGVRAAQALGAKTLLFFDQDSCPPEGFVDALLRDLSPGVPNVVAPACFDARSGVELPSFRLGGIGSVVPVFASRLAAAQSVDLVISSGSAATTETFAQVGLFDEEFFIDYVDFEWCFRCRWFGVPVRVAPAARLAHIIGERDVDFGLFRGVVHSPARTYYKLRNPLLMLRKPWVPPLYACREAILAVMQLVALMPGLSQRRAYFEALGNGLLDGMRGVSGPHRP